MKTPQFPKKLRRFCGHCPLTLRDRCAGDHSFPNLLGIVTERVRAVTISTARCTHWLWALRTLSEDWFLKEKRYRAGQGSND